MKNTLALVLIVFGIVGCATSQNSYGEYKEGIYTSAKQISKFIEGGGYQYKALGYPKAKALPVNISETGDVFTIPGIVVAKFYIDGGKKFVDQDSVSKFVLENCEKKFLTYCILEYEGDKEVWYENFEVFVNQPQLQAKRMEQEEIFKAARLIRENDEKKRLAKIKEQKRIQVEKINALEKKKREKAISRLKARCKEYGFTGESNIAACIQREAQHEMELAMKKSEIDNQADANNQSEIANQAILNNIYQQQAEAKRQREANALMNLGAIIGGAGTPAPSSTRSKVTTPSYPTYTSSMTVPSNQLCPQLASRLVKQEVVRGNRICYYQ